MTNTADYQTVKINYILTFPEAKAHYVQVEMQISGLNQATLDLKMAVWAPGSYMVREFSRNVESLSAEANGKSIPVSKIRKNIWRIASEGLKNVVVRYRVYAFEISVRTSFIDASHAFLSSPDIFVYPDGMLDQPVTVHIEPYNGWTNVSTGLTHADGNKFTLVSPNYDILFDSPIEIGTQDVISFEVGEVKYHISMAGEGNYDAERLKSDFTKIIKEQQAIFGENPNEDYTFIIHNRSKGGGGLEHLNSTVLGAQRDGYADEEIYKAFLKLVSHEHFHLWNVKRLRPFALGPFDYDNENYTTNLWIAEGFTSYYQDIIVQRTGLYTNENYLDWLANAINVLENQPGRNIQTVAESSFDAWIKGYRPNENSANATISYYNKGQLIGLLLDLEIINSTKGSKSLDDVMRYMYDSYYKKQHRGFTDREFKTSLEQIADKNLDQFYENYINGLTPLNYDQYLDYAGYQLVDELAGNNNATIGITTKTTNNVLSITTVARNSAAWIAGLSVNDEIVAINGESVTSLDGILAGKTPGEEMIFEVRRDELPITITVILLKSVRVKYKIESVNDLNTEQLVVRKKWLRS
jgi:predicted metalloprotease with PDZ domain